MNTVIEGGLVRIEDGLKAKEEYAPPRKVTVELRFVTFEDDDEFEGENRLNYAVDLAQRKVAELLGGIRVETTKETPADAPVKPAAKTKAPPKAKPVVADPMGLGDEGGGEGEGKEAPQDPMGLDEAGADFNAPIEPEVAEITDDDLNDAAQAANNATNNATAIRALIAGYNPDKTKQFQLRQIPQAERAGFVAKLKDSKLVPKLG